MAIVYQHRTADTNELFYIGIGKKEERAHFNSPRSEFWKRVVGKHGRIVEILFKDISWEEACQIETYLIRFYGRSDQGGILINRTDGGNGAVGYVPSAEARAKISKAKKGIPRSAETRAKLAFAQTGKKLSDEIKAKMSKSGKGKKVTPETIAKRIAKTTGKKRSEEMKERCRQRRHTAESKEKMRLAKIGKKTGPCSEEKKKAISAAQKGIPKPSSKNSKTLFKKGHSKNVQHANEKKQI
jgi:hypothetical protein